MSIEISEHEASAQLPALMARAVADREVVLVRRSAGEAVALIAADELSGLLDTAHLLRSPRNAERLLRALERARHEQLEPTALEPTALEPTTLETVQRDAGITD